jgi:hypothetical protein
MADRYWVGGSANWDGTAGTKWALTSGGAGGEAVPTSADDVFFSSLSTGTCTISTGNTGAKSINCTGFTGTLAGIGNITVSGSVTLSAGMSFSYAGVLTINALATLNTAGKSMPCQLNIDAAGTTVTLGANATTTSAGTIHLRGTLALNNFTLTTPIFQCNTTNTRAISFGTGNIVLTSPGTGLTVLRMETATGFSWTGTGGFIRNMTVASTVAFGSTAGGTISNAPNLTVNAGTSTLTITSGSYFNNLIFTGSTSTVSGTTVNIAGNLTLASGGTYTSVIFNFLDSGTITSNGRTISNATINIPGGTLTLADAMTVGSGSPNSTTLTAGTLNLAGFTLSTAVFISNNNNTRAITFGSGNIALTSTLSSTTILSMNDVSGFSQTGTGGFTRNMGVTATVNFGTSVGSGNATNACNLTVNAGGATLTIQGTSWFKNVSFVGSTSTVTAGSTVRIAGNLTLSSGGFYTSMDVLITTSGTITSNGRTLGAVQINGSGITVTLADAMTLSSTDALTLTQGTFTAANFNVTAGRFSSSNSNTRTLNMGSGTWTLTATSTFAWSTATTTGFTINPSTSTITMTSSSAKTFAGGGLTYYNLNQGGAGTLTISGSNTFNDITNTVQPSTVTFTAGTTQTVSNFSLAGTAGNLITINSDTPGSQFTLSKASGTVNAQYLAIQDSNATGGATWNSLLAGGNVDNGNNTGWIFSAVVAATGNMFLMFN